ncbi:hypothetical protein PP175_29685 (plasmid) [Aneurinibacillus sp. Ricciae_BoGa-3]|uniref:hypothetical protein n=1 Tax=Aneurinibacillus sp. Ricciae_BoGa-3 TaxID=3022697 RepID=UPI00233FF48A|nr:hypothetical protein [Aneurinibacillus sp. Ricciae_BoGa-3]WCK57364.1 hypothetical protein PP175_29685 [Aneurinibacillus sp. Ricciae_BoGa-3]
MVPISIEQFVSQYTKNNPSTNKKSFTNKLNESVNSKKFGAVCIQCGNPIWAIGSAVADWNGCFTCITGESDSDDDYEIDDVC